jgi:hypothetical protein
MFPLRKAVRVFVALLGINLLALPGSGEIIPANRRMIWQGNVGVPGGIPNRTKIFVNVKTTSNPRYRCAGDGVINDAPALQAALNACPAGEVVYVPTSTYRIATPVDAKVSNKTLRGDGMGRTIFLLTDGTGRFQFGRGQNVKPGGKSAGGLFVSVTSGATAGSTVLTVKDTSIILTNHLVTLQMDTPTWMHSVTQDREGLDAKDDLFRMTFKVVSKTATTVTITPPLPMTLSSWNPRIVASGMYGSGYLTTSFGMEDCTVNAWNGAGFPVKLAQAWGCWVKGVEICGTKSRQIYMLTVCASEIRQCYTRDTQGSGPNHEGIDFAFDCCWNLVEDNICVNAGNPAIIFGDGRGRCVGNVVAYNYTDMDDSPANGAVFRVTISDNHGVGNMLNLYEGNLAKGFIADGYFGSSSHGTLLRNFIHNTSSNLNPASIILNHYSVYYNVIGNVLGSPTAQSSAYEKEPGVQSAIYRLGFSGNVLRSAANIEGVPNPHYNNLHTIGPTMPPDYHLSPNSRAKAIAIDLNVKNTIIRHGNYDYASKTGLNFDGSGGNPKSPGIVWETDDSRKTGVDFADHKIPKSYYLKAKPDWWPAAVPWPPIGPDKEPMVSALPAEIRFKALQASLSKPAANPKLTSTKDSTSP